MSTHVHNKLGLALLISAGLHGLLWLNMLEDAAIANNHDAGTHIDVELLAQQMDKAPRRTVAEHKPVHTRPAQALPVADTNEPVIARVTHEQAETPAAQPADFERSQEQFVSLLHQAIDEQKHYPGLAKRQGREGKVKLTFVVHPDGQVTDIEVVSSSRFTPLDEAARLAVVAISPFQLAQNYISQPNSFDVNIDFRLN